MRKKPARVRVVVEAGSEVGKSAVDPMMEFVKTFELDQLPAVPCNIFIGDPMLQHIPFFKPTFFPAKNMYSVRCEPSGDFNMYTPAMSRLYKLHGWAVSLVGDERSERA